MEKEVRTVYEYVTGFIRDKDGNPLMNWTRCSKEKYEEEFRINWQTARTYETSTKISNTR